MTSRADVSKKLKRKNLPQIELDVYSNIPVNDLLIYAMYFLQEQGIAATVEDIISVCFRLFPHSFSLKHYPRWPDSALVIRRLNDGREKGIIKGNAVNGFSLNYKGKQLAKRVAKGLGLVKPESVKAKKKTVPAKKKAGPGEPVQTHVEKVKVAPQKSKSVEPVAEKKSPKRQLTRLVRNIVSKLIKPSEQAVKAEPVKEKQETLPKKPVKVTASVPGRKALVKEEPHLAVPGHVTKEEKTRAGKVVRLMESSDAYRQYKKNGSRSKISEFDFRNMLFTTMESSPETLIRNVELFKSYAGIHNRPDLIAFLAFCEGSFASLLKPQAKTPAKKKR